MTAAPVRVACVGAGYFSRFHRDGWQADPRASLVGVCDRDPVRAASTGVAHYSDLASLLDQTRPDLLDVIVPPGEQADVIRTALLAGVRTIICQKPFCRDLDEARDIVATARAADTLLIVHENFRFQPWWRTIRDALANGLIGTPLNATFRLRPGDGQGPDAYLDRQPYFRNMDRFLVHETLVHYLDVFRFLFGDPLAVYADLRRINPAIVGEDAGVILLDHPGGLRAVIDGNRHLDHAAENLRCTMGEALIEGTGGTLTLTGDGAVALRRFGELEIVQLLPPDTTGGFGGGCAAALQSHVLDALLTGTPVENTATDYLRVLEIESTAYASAASGQRLRLDT